ncbi:hypothetical protein JCM6882_000264 [Rhodosporidiobolus microsporus]
MDRYSPHHSADNPYPARPLYPTEEPFHPLPHDSPHHSPALGAAEPLSPNSHTYFDSYESRGGHHEGERAATGGKEEGAVHGTAPHHHRTREERGGRSRWRAFWATYKSRNQIVFLSLIALQAVAVLAMIALVYATMRLATGDVTTTEILNSDPELQSVATYLSLFILAVIFEIAITLDAMQQKNIMTLVVLCFFQVALLVYSSVLPSQLADAINGSNADTPNVRRLTRIYAIVIPCVVGACTVAMSGMLWPLYGEFGWDVFKRIGADIAIRRYFKRYQVFVCLLKFDGFFFVGFAVQFLVLVSGTPTVEFVLTIVALPVILIALALFAIAVRIESRTGVYISFVVQAAGMAYFVYKLVRIYQTATSDRYDAAKATLTIFSIISLAMLLATFVMMGLCMANFGKGLRERIPGYAFNGGRPLLSTRPSFGRRASGSHPYTIDDAENAGRPGRAGAGGEKPGLGRQGSSFAYEAGRTQTRMSLD